MQSNVVKQIHLIYSHILSFNVIFKKGPTERNNGISKIASKDSIDLKKMANINLYFLAILSSKTKISIIILISQIS